MTTDKWVDTTIRVLICDDYAVTRRRVVVALEQRPDIEVVGEAAEPTSAESIGRETNPDLVLVGSELGQAGAAQTAARIRQGVPSARALVLGIPEDSLDGVEAVKAGAVGFIDRNTLVENVADAVRTVYGGSPILPAPIATAVIEAFDRLAAPEGAPAGGLRRPKLTDRERKVLELLAAEHSLDEAASLLDLLPGTAANLAANALLKLMRLHDAEVALEAASARAVPGRH
ncbi:MAG: response regulator transcription factor [Acidimicrobiales bacterium]|nr:response regulator transcription factor [Acidimicrobiales bacterium]